MEKIPENCIMNKGTTGCGATTLATIQRTPTLIAAPFTELIRNKAAQFPENNENRPVLLPIYGEGDKSAEIAQYMQRHGDLPKIMTSRILDSLGYDPYGEMHLCVDEWHLLFNQYSFRNRAIRNLMSITGNFERVTYMSATPIERKYWLEELLGFRNTG